MRNAFADEVKLLRKTNDKVVLLSGDIGNRLFDKFKADYAEYFLNCGIAEANMMGMAAGLALSGFRPIVYTITPFTTTRCFEQIRVDVCYHQVPVIIVGTGSGLSYAELGPTHHSCEDIAIMRSLPNMTVFCPADAVELSLGLEAALKIPNPVYMRIGKKGEPILHQKRPKFEFGKSITLKNGSDVCIISTGTITSVALEAAMLLENQGISVRVESFHTVKPLDTASLTEIFNQYSLVVSMEEHSYIGGLFGAIAEWRATQHGKIAKLIPIAVKDEFIHEVGNQQYARKKNGLTKENIVSTIVKNVANSKTEILECI